MESTKFTLTIQCCLSILYNTIKPIGQGLILELSVCTLAVPTPSRLRLFVDIIIVVVVASALGTSSEDNSAINRTVATIKFIRGFTTE